MSEGGSSIVETGIFWDTLIQLIAEGQVVPIVGQDLLTLPESTGHKLLYPYLADHLAEYLGVSGESLSDGDELNDVACRFLEQGNQIEDIYAALKTIASKAEALPIPEPLLRLAQIRPFRLFVTTTFDSSLARALDQTRFDGSQRTAILAHSPTDIQDLRANPDTAAGPIVYHLMGKLSATPAYAVTQEDTVEFFHSLQSETHKPSLLFDELNRRTLLLLGNRLGGWLTRFFIRMSKRERLSIGGKTDYLADARVISDKSLVMFLRSFSKATKIYRAGGALDFVNELHERWLQTHPNSSVGTVPTAKSEVSPGAVFLSYASDDSVAVERIKVALEAAGIDVFFDRDRLQTGDDWEAKLRQNIRQCSLFVPVISRQTLTLERRFFRIEWNLALEEAKMASFSFEDAFLLPVVIDDTTIDEPNLPPAFRRFQWKPLQNGNPTPDFVARIQQLFRKYQKARVGVS